MPGSTENEETTPLVYEDRALSPKASSVRRKSVFVILGTVCLGLGLCLAVALPITLKSSGGSSNPVQGPVLYSGARLPNNSRREFNDTRHTTEESTGESTTSGTTSHSTRHRRTLPPTSHHHRWIPTSPADDPVTDDYDDDTTSRFTRPTRGPFHSCPGVLPGRRSHIDLELLNGKLLFELYRVQTDNTPVYVHNIACSTMELDLKNGSQGVNGTMKLNWAESRFFSRHFKSLDVNLEGKDQEPYEFTESVEGNPSQGQLSFLVQIDGYLLTYECFPDVPGYTYPRPGYAIHLYSLLPWRGDEWLAEALMTLANVWGLNPGVESRERVAHYRCSRD